MRCNDEVSGSAVLGKVAKFVGDWKVCARQGRLRWLPVWWRAPFAVAPRKKNYADAERRWAARGRTRRGSATGFRPRLGARSGCGGLSPATTAHPPQPSPHNKLPLLLPTAQGPSWRRGFLSALRHGRSLSPCTPHFSGRLASPRTRVPDLSRAWDQLASGQALARADPGGPSSAIQQPFLCEGAASGQGLDAAEVCSGLSCAPHTQPLRSKEPCWSLSTAAQPSCLISSGPE